MLMLKLMLGVIVLVVGGRVDRCIGVVDAVGVFDIGWDLESRRWSLGGLYLMGLREVMDAPGLLRRIAFVLSWLDEGIVIGGDALVVKVSCWGSPGGFESYVVRRRGNL